MFFVRATGEIDPKAVTVMKAFGRPNHFELLKVINKQDANEPMDTKTSAKTGKETNGPEKKTQTQPCSIFQMLTNSRRFKQISCGQGLSGYRATPGARQRDQVPGKA